MRALGRRWLRRWAWPAGITLVILLGALLRLVLAWTERYAANGDFGIVALMARHMVAGTDYPVFSYGVAYMGGLEPILSAVLAWGLRGDGTAFPINLGTVLPGIGLLPLIYSWGRDAGGRRAGLMALLYCVVGADVLLHYSVAPRGGYMTLMTGGVLALWLSCRVVARENHGRQAAAWMYGVIGLAVGVAWWATQLVGVFAVTAALVFLLGWRWRFLWRGTLPAVAGFLSGSLPWWIWNHAHGWVSLDFGESLGKVRFSEGLASFGSLFLEVVEMDSGSWLAWCRLALLLVLGAGFIAVVVADVRRGRERERFHYRLAAPLLVLVMALFYSTSHFARANASRYLLPLVPGLAVMLGVACDRLLSRFRFPWGWLLLALVLPTQVWQVQDMFGGAATEKLRWNMAANLERQAGPLCGQVLVGDYYTFHWMNYATQERLCVATLPHDRYAPYTRRAELEARRGYLDDFEDLGAFLSATRGRSRQMSVDGLRVDYDLQAPDEGWDYVRGGGVRVTQGGGEGGDMERSLLDGDLKTSWQCQIPAGGRTNITFAFTEPQDLAGVRLLSLEGWYPDALQVEGRLAGREEWRALAPLCAVTPYFWSGPVAMLGGKQYYLEYRFGPLTDRVDEVRVTVVNRSVSEQAARVGEVLFMSRATPPAAPAVEVEAVARLLDKEAVGQVYAPRWLAERLIGKLGSGTAVALPSLFTRGIDEMAQDEAMTPEAVPFARRTGMLMDGRDAERSRSVLRQAGIAWHEQVLGRLVLLVVEALPASGPGALPAGEAMYWTELGCMGVRSLKLKAQALYAAARSGAAPGVEPLRRALEYYPFHYPARCLLVERLLQAGCEAEAQEAERQLRELTQPDLPAPVRFGNGVKFMGLSFGTRLSAKGEVGPATLVVKRGSVLALTYFWNCPEKVDPRQYAVFLHVVQGRSRLQDDHILMLSVPAVRREEQVFEEIVSEPRTLTVPADLAVGDYRVSMGLVERHADYRLGVRTDLPTRHDAVILPLTIRVE